SAAGASRCRASATPGRTTRARSSPARNGARTWPRPTLRTARSASRRPPTPAPSRSAAAAGSEPVASAARSARARPAAAAAGAGRVASPALLELHAAKRTTTKRSVRIRSKAQCAPRARVTETSRPHDDLHLERVPDDDVFAFGRADELSLIVAEALRD